MDINDKPSTDEQEAKLTDGTAIEKGLEQMEMIYRSRCVQAPTGKNVTVREIVKEE